MVKVYGTGGFYERPVAVTGRRTAAAQADQSRGDVFASLS